MSVSDLHFPELDFARTGLKAVVCQLQFNPILRVGRELPVDFQEALRQRFPKFAPLTEEQIQFRVELPAARGIGSSAEVLPVGSGAKWVFSSEDDTSTASLSSSSVSLETTAYRNFAQFFEDFHRVYSALHESLPGGINHFTRVGLRYINVFEQAQFPGSWVPRFNPALIGPMADQLLGPSVALTRQRFVLAEDDWVMNVQHGTDDEGNYRLDIDHAINDRVEEQDVAQKLEMFNRRIYQVFRWAISDAMFNEMEPHERAQ
jgi:uncharacterized protein (TIGR04255 family)